MSDTLAHSERAQAHMPFLASFIAFTSLPQSISHTWHEHLRPEAAIVNTLIPHLPAQEVLELKNPVLLDAQPTVLMSNWFSLQVRVNG